MRSTDAALTTTEPPSPAQSTKLPLPPPPQMRSSMCSSICPTSIHSVTPSYPAAGAAGGPPLLVPSRSSCYPQRQTTPRCANCPQLATQHMWSCHPPPKGMREGSLGVVEGSVRKEVRAPFTTTRLPSPTQSPPPPALQLTVLTPLSVPAHAQMHQLPPIATTNSACVKLPPPSQMASCHPSQTAA